MRFQGKIEQWKDEQGYGFVMPNGGGPKAFVHIKAFDSLSERPVDGDVIIYTLTTDSKGRLVASNVHYASHRKAASKPRVSKITGLVIGMVFVLTLVLTSTLGVLPSGIATVYLMTSMLTFLAYAMDKSAAKQRKWRTTENTLHGLSLIGGWPGALIAQHILRHKSSKQSFQAMFWLTVIINCMMLAWVMQTLAGA